ncbi:unnamed protein product [Effrenium voratum]|nr:unnamed protein product [Effrenium voratum]
MPRLLDTTSVFAKDQIVFIENPNQVQKLGDCPDFGSCKKKGCKLPCNTAQKEAYCKLHLNALYSSQSYESLRAAALMPRWALSWRTPGSARAPSCSGPPRQGRRRQRKQGKQGTRETGPRRNSKKAGAVASLGRPPLRHQTTANI